MAIYSFFCKIKKGCRKVFVEPLLKRTFGFCGKNVHIPKGCDFIGGKNISVGNNVFFGLNNTILSAKAKLIIKDNVMFGPNVTVITGDHRIDILDRPMCSITDDEKLPENDQDVVIEEDVWVGAGATILKGVTIGSGSVVAAGALVKKDVPPYAVVGGVPAKIIKMRK